MRGPVFLVLVWLATAGAAGAQDSCSCARCPNMPIFQVGGVQASNLRILARLDPDVPDPILTNAAGESIEIAVEPAGDASRTARWVRSLAPLPPGSYVLALTGRMSFVRAEFTVTSGAIDTTPPVWGELGPASTVHSPYCWDIDGVEVAWAPTDATAVRITLEVEVRRGPELLGVVFPAQTGYPNTAVLGTSLYPACFGAAILPGVLPGDELTLTARIWDTSGNASADRVLTVVAEHFAAAPASCEGPCSANPGPPRGRGRTMALAGLMLLGALALRRARGLTAAG